MSNAIERRRANLEARAIKIQRQLKDLSASLAFPIDGEKKYDDDKFERVMWALHGFKYAGMILMHTLDAERIYSEVIAEMNAAPVKITLHETT
jgi:hypothetical protein